MQPESRFEAIRDLVKAILIHHLGKELKVCVEFENAWAFGLVATCFRMRRNRKNWGQLVSVKEVPEDFEWPSPFKAAWQYKPHHPSVIRFQQRARLRYDLGSFSGLVSRAMRQGKAKFMATISEAEDCTVQIKLGLTVACFWQCVRGSRPYDGPRLPLFEG